MTTFQARQHIISNNVAHIIAIVISDLGNFCT